MTFSDGDFKALRMLLREEIDGQIRPLRNTLTKRFDEIAEQIDGLYKRDETREHEYLSMREQLKRLEKRA